MRSKPLSARSRSMQRSASRRRIARIAYHAITAGTNVSFGLPKVNGTVREITDDGYLLLEGRNKPLSPLDVWGVG